MPPTFAQLGVPEPISRSLAASGITDPFAIQAATIADALAGRDVCGRAPTGSGKTLAFGIPLVASVDRAEPRRPRGLVLAPTRELAEQICSELRTFAGRVRIAVVYGGVGYGPQLKALREGVDVLVACPGRLEDLLEQGQLRLDDVDRVVIDEADRLADMGFMPQVEWILRHSERNHQTLLFSATLDGMVGGLIRRYQREPVMHEVVTREVTVAEMEHRFLAVHEMDQVKVAATIINSNSRTLLFVRTRWGADKLNRQLDGEGVNSAAIHGDLRQAHREKSLADFSKGRIQALVATDVAARGIHVDDVDVVIHFDPPSDAKTYVHRSGRTARAGESGVVVSLVRWDGELEVRKLMRRLGLKEPIVEIFSNDSRLADLLEWDPTEDAA